MSSLSLSVRDLVVIGDRDRTLLSVDALDLAPGETLGIRGPSGAGKSTFLFALAGLAGIKSGQVLWGETDLASLREEGRARFRRQSLGMIFQDFLLFEELDAVANATIAAGYLDAAMHAGLRQTASATLERLKISQTENRTIASYSGGERQRVAIARALAHDPAVILADEPTASLDRSAADMLIEDLVALVREENKTLIVVSHDLHLHERMDRVIEIVDGTMVGEVHHG